MASIHISLAPADARTLEKMALKNNYVRPYKGTAYGNLSAFLSAIAQGKIPIGESIEGPTVTCLMPTNEIEKTIFNALSNQLGSKTKVLNYLLHQEAEKADF